jgi:S-adenosylmethionine decarboxylase proenzyme
LVEYWGCNEVTLDSVSQIQALLEQAAHAANTRIVDSIFRPFEPQGVTGVVVIEESHLSIHTWPEHRYASVDFYTCGKGDPNMAHEVILSGLQATEYELIHVDRGLLRGVNVMQVQDHVRHSVF